MRLVIAHGKICGKRVIIDAFSVFFYCIVHEKMVLS